MNKLIHTAPPSALGYWLSRSLAWTVACAAGFWPLLYWACDGTRMDRGSRFLLLAWLTAIQILAWKKGIADFSRAYHDSSPPAEAYLKAMALFWLTLLVSLAVWATLLCVFGWLLWAVAA